MNRGHWKVWVAGIVLVQLLVIVVAVLLWPTPCEAEWWAALIRVGMTEEEAKGVLGSEPSEFLPRSPRSGPYRLTWTFGDDSTLCVCSDRNEKILPPMMVNRIDVWRPTPVPPLTSLRRTLARALPFLGE